jgi:hypothetical protein
MTFIWCECKRHDPKCWVCTSKRKAYRAGKRAYRMRRSRNEKTRWTNSGFHFHWTNGWDDGRKANPHTAARRAQEEAAVKTDKLRRLQRERMTLDRQIKALSS